MTLPTYVTPFADNTKITPAFLNDYVRTIIPLAIDGDGGGSYTPSDVIKLGGSGMRLEGTSNIALASRLITRTVPLYSVAGETAGVPHWGVNASGELVASAAVGGWGYIPLDLPHGSTVSKIQVRFKGAGGHGGGAPVPMPSWNYYRMDLDGTGTLIDTKVLAWPGQVAYELYQWIEELAIAAHVVDRTLNRYFLRIESEGNAGPDGYKLGAVIPQIRVAITTTSYTEW